MKKITLLLCHVLLLMFAAMAQMDSKSIKKLNKANDLAQKRKYEDAEKIYTDILKKYPYYSTVWDAYAKAAFEQYEYEKATERSFKITVNGSNNAQNDSLAKQLAELLSGVKVSRKYYTKAINICREATLKCEYPQASSTYLRIYYFDSEIKVDENINDSANKMFKKAEKLFAQRNFSEAIKYYQNAIDLDSNFYFAKLYLGDSYYMLADYVNAIPFFRSAVKKQPKLVEPRKYLVDALMNIDAYDEAFEECIQALLVYPDIGMYNRLETIVNKKGKAFNKKWIPRDILPAAKLLEVPKNADKNWQPYLNAKNNLDTSIYDKKTLLRKSTEKNSSPYFEVHCWEELLKTAPQEAFKDAREMQAKGYLDCYVLFSLFHVDYKDQFIHLVKNDRIRLRNYIDLLIE